jgi:hypothetical protein
MTTRRRLAQIIVKNSDLTPRGTRAASRSSLCADNSTPSNGAICLACQPKWLKKKGNQIPAWPLLWLSRRRLSGFIACPAAAPGYRRVNVGKLRAQLGRAIGARGLFVVCPVLLASTLLTGCNETSTTSTSAGATAMSGPGTQSLSLSTTPTRLATPPPTAASTPAPANKSVDVTWTAPTANTNGSALTNLAGYTIHYGTSTTALTKSVDVASAGATDYLVQGLAGGTWYFAVTAYTNTGLQSSYSSIVSKTIT